MAKIWCTVPRMIFVGGFEQPAVHSTGATAKKHFTRISVKKSFDQFLPSKCFCQVIEWHQANIGKIFGGESRMHLGEMRHKIQF